MVTLPAVEGEMGIFPMHIPLMTQLVAGEIAVRKGHQDFFLAIGDGFVEVTGDRVSVLTDMAIRAENIDEVKAEEARRRAEARMAEKLDDEESAAVQAAFKAAEARYTAVEEVDTEQLARWLAEAREVQWDYKNLIRRKGKLERLK